MLVPAFADACRLDVALSPHDAIRQAITTEPPPADTAAHAHTIATQMHVHWARNGTPKGAAGQAQGPAAQRHTLYPFRLISFLVLRAGFTGAQHEKMRSHRVGVPIGSLPNPTVAIFQD